MTKQKQTLLEKLQTQEVSLVTGTLAIATAFLVALSVMPSVSASQASLLDASVFNLVDVYSTVYGG